MGFWEGVQLPEDISTHGHLIDGLFNYVTIMNVIWFALVCAGLFGFSYLYSQKRHPKPYYTYGNKKKHLLLTAGIGLGVFLSIDLNITRISNNDMVNVFWNFPDDEEDVVKIEVMAQQWAWKFRYAGADGEFNTADDIITLNEMVIPVNKKVYLNITSKDVIHSFYVPNIRIKVDAIPGRITRIWFDTNKTGKYEIACAEMCGTHHYLMRSNLTILNDDEFAKWKNQAHELALATFDSNNIDQFWGWQWK